MDGATAADVASAAPGAEVLAVGRVLEGVVGEDADRQEVDDDADKAAQLHPQRTIDAVRQTSGSAMMRMVRLHQTSALWPQQQQRSNHL